MQRKGTTPPRHFSRVIKTITKRNKRTKRADMRGRHTKETRLRKIQQIMDSIPKGPTCANCSMDLDYGITTDDGNALVCRYCGVVDSMPIFDTDQIPFGCIPGSPLYRHRNYFAERISQARDKEPRLCEDELDTLSMVYNLYKASGSIFWYEGFFTKKHMSMICSHLVKRFPRSFWTRRVERWFQYRTYICGHTGIQLPGVVASTLRFLFDAYSRYFQISLKKTQTKKANITQLDMVILVLLFSVNPRYLQDYGWYFLNRNLINKTPSVYSNYAKVKSICDTINGCILHEYDNTIPKSCYQWFRCGNKIAVPDLDDLIDGALGSELGAIQYANYCKANSVGALLFYNKYKGKMPTE